MCGARKCVSRFGMYVWRTHVCVACYMCVCVSVPTSLCLAVHLPAQLELVVHKCIQVRTYICATCRTFYVRLCCVCVSVVSVFVFMCNFERKMSDLLGTCVNQSKCRAYFLFV